jgi:geranylgeranyl diphosphate synthase type II
VKVVQEVACAAGIHGMVGGQAQDILAENADPDRGILDFIHRHKTAALITASVRIGSILANAGKRKLQAMTRYGENIGLVFQIVDDILNVVGTTRETGKPVGSDSRKHKLTYPAVYGLESARKQTDVCLSNAIEALRVFSSGAEPLRQIAYYLVKRRK